MPEDSDERLVLSLIPKEFSTLGLPPDFGSVTRDRFETGTQFATSFIENVLRDIAGAARHLHNRGIAHGDLYAHNILSDPGGRSILGDFGAASFYKRDASRLREQVETRAFGFLIDDLLGQLESKRAGTVPQSILEIRTWCGNSITKELPTFDDIQLMLDRNSTH